MSSSTDLTMSPRPDDWDKSTFGGTLSEALVLAGDRDEVVLPGSIISVDIGGLRSLIKNWLGLTPAQFAMLSDSRRDHLTDRLRRRIEREFKRRYPERYDEALRRARGVAGNESMSSQRGRLFRDRLVPWSRGELRLERPSGSSLHHLLRYDALHTEGTFYTAIRDEDLQSFVVENDWGRLDLPSDGEWRLPFALCCWEMRISGVRVLAFTDSSPVSGDPVMWTVYGADDHWVMDDYLAVIHQDRLQWSPIEKRPDPVQFRAVTEMVVRQIRAACILMDARVCRGERVEQPRPLVERARRERRPVPRDYVVVRLSRMRQQRVARSAGHSSGETRAPQRGHWRRGTWVHFDDPDSGKVQYANDGGFFVSKTWRHWHFAGDPNNILEREYRL